MLKMFSRDPRVQLASLQPRKTIGLGVGAFGSQPLRSIAMFTLCRIHAPLSLRERRRRFGYTLPYLVNPLSLLIKSSLNLPLWLRGGFEVGRHARRLSRTTCTKIRRFAEYVSGWSGYKSSHISATIASIRSKFATEVPKALYFHNPALTQKMFRRLMVPFRVGTVTYTCNKDILQGKSRLIFPLNTFAHAYAHAHWHERDE